MPDDRPDLPPARGPAALVGGTPAAGPTHGDVLGRSEADEYWHAELTERDAEADPADLLATISTDETAVRAAQAQQVRLLARWVQRHVGPGCDTGCGCDIGSDALLEAIEAVALEVAPHLRWTAVTAQNRVADAYWLTTALPHTLDALAGGRLDYQRARLVAESTVLCSVPDARTVDARIAGPEGPAPQLTTGQLRTLLARTVAAVDPAAVRRRAARATANRRVTYQPLADGQAELVMTGPALAVRTVYERATALAHDTTRPGARTDPWASDTDADAGGGVGIGACNGDDVGTSAAVDQRPRDSRTLDARRFDALAELATYPVPDAPGVGATAGPQVTVALSTLLGTDELPAELAGHGPVGADQARLAARTGRLRRAAVHPVTGQLVALEASTYPAGALEDPVARRRIETEPFTDPCTDEHHRPPVAARDRCREDVEPAGTQAPAGRSCAEAGQPTDADCPVDAAVSRYRPGPAAARLVRTRNPTCTAAGCRAPASRCDLDHVVRYPDGPTCPCNLTPLCRRHHRAKHRRGWTLTRSSDGSVHWTSPLGHQYTVRPPPLLPRG